MLISTVAVIFICFSHIDTLYLSFNKSASSSTTHSYFLPEKVTDGDDNSNMFTPCFHSTLGFQQWLEIDLKNEYKITRVTIINRVEAGPLGCNDCHLRLVDAAIGIGSGSDIANFTKCGKSVTLAQVQLSPIIDVRCQKPISGRYVTVWYPTKSEQLNFCEVRVYNENEPDIRKFDSTLHPVGAWELNINALLYQLAFNMTSPMINIVESITDHQWTKVLEPVNQIIKLDNINFSSFRGFTVAFYIYPHNFSMGNIILIGDPGSLRMEQTYSNGRLYQSEVTVYFDDQQLTRAHVLLPETWTFLTLAFNGTITLWRNGEIVSFKNTGLNSLDFNAHQLQIGSASGQLIAEVAALQLYDRALNKADIKLAMSQPPICTNKRALFETMMRPLEGMPIVGVAGQILKKAASRTRTECSRMCLRSLCCDAFSFGKNDHVCILLSNHLIDSEEMNFERYRIIAQYPALLNRKVVCFDK